MVAMFVVGRLVRQGRPAASCILAGLAADRLLAVGDDAASTLDVGSWDIVRTGIIQGVGLGLIFVPLETIAFATWRRISAPKPRACSA